MRVRKRPFVLSHGINARCNLRCKFCDYWQENGKEMSTEAIFGLLDEARSFGIGVYNAWTAEPLLRPDLPKILHHAKERGMVTSMITNGMLLRKRVHELDDLDRLSVSVDGIESYREIRGAPIDPVLEGIEAAQDAGHQVLINCVISGKNLDEVEDLVRLAQEMGTLISFEPLHVFEGMEREVWDEMAIRDLSRYRKTMDRLLEMKNNGYPIINSLTYLKMVRDQNPSFRCHASDIVLHVTADGSIVNCRVQREPLGHLEDGLLNVWRSSRERRREIVQSCKGCLFFGYVENSLLYDLNTEVMAHYGWI